MSFGLLVIVTLIYAGIAIDSLIHGHGGQSIIFAGYSVANIGLLIGMKP